MARTVHRLCAKLLAALAVALLCSPPCQALEHAVRPGETLRGVARAYKVSPALLARANGLKPDAKIRSGAVLTIPSLAAALPPPVADHRDLIAGKPVAGVKGLGGKRPGEARQRPDNVVVTPNTRPAAESVTPNSPVDRDPKTFGRSTAGVRATFQTDPDTEVIGILGAPDGPGAAYRPYGKPEPQTGSSPSGGVLLKRSF